MLDVGEKIRPSVTRTFSEYWKNVFFETGLIIGLDPLFICNLFFEYLRATRQNNFREMQDGRSAILCNEKVQIMLSAVTYVLFTLYQQKRHGMFVSTRYTHQKGHACGKLWLLW